jgi:hypothetical protein
MAPGVRKRRPLRHHSNKEAPPWRVAAPCARLHGWLAWLARRRAAAASAAAVPPLPPPPFDPSPSGLIFSLAGPGRAEPGPGQPAALLAGGRGWWRRGAAAPGSESLVS